MDLTRIKNDIPSEVREWAEQNAGNTSFSFVSVISYRYKEIVERTFSARRYAKKGVLITEVQRRATGNNHTVIKNLLFTSYSGYIPVFEKEDRYEGCGWYCKVFEKTDFDRWYTVDAPCGFYNVCLNKDFLTKIEEFKYCGFSGGDVIKYLNEYRKNPMIEFFGKLDLPISSTLISKAQNDKQFRMYLYKYASKVRAYGPQATIYAFNHSITIPEAMTKLHNRKRALKKIPAMRGHNLDCERIIDYCNTNKVDYSNYNDYIEAVIGIGLDLNDTKNIYPKDFNAMHDLRITEYESQRAKVDRKSRKELYESFAKAGEKAKAYEYSKNGFTIIAPKDISDLVIEGKILGHCVGKMGYDKKMAEGKVVIMFCRKTQDIQSPYVTIEYDLKLHKLLQAYGKKNTKPSEETMIFINDWLAVMKKIRKKNVA